MTNIIHSPAEKMDGAASVTYRLLQEGSTFAIQQEGSTFILLIEGTEQVRTGRVAQFSPLLHVSSQTTVVGA